MPVLGIAREHFGLDTSYVILNDSFSNFFMNSETAYTVQLVHYIRLK